MASYRPHPGCAKRAISLRDVVASMLVFSLVVAGLTSVVTAKELTDPFLQSTYFSPDVDSQGVEQVQYVAEATDLPTANFQPPPVYHDADVTLSSNCCPPLGYDHPAGGQSWQVLPDGLIYRSYLAGPREPRIGTTVFDNHLGGIENSQTLWDGTVGGRRGLIRFGTTDPLSPEGFQIDIEGAALVRLNLDENRDVDASDFRFGVPITCGDQCVQYKFAYYHLSSHLGDELIARTPGATRINYVRDVLLLGMSYRPAPAWRVYGEVGAAVFIAGGAETWETQFGFEYSQSGPTGVWGTPFFATNAHLREELDFGGDWTTQLGWLWRGKSGSTFRTGLHYVNGKSTQYQFFDNHEEQIGFGVWYDF